MISIIVPAYNHSAYLEAALNSVLAQTIGEWKCLVVNDGSTDSTGAIAEQYSRNDSRFSVIHKINGGLSAARNTGLASITGEFVVFFDSDDVLHPQMLEKMSAVLRRRPDLPGAVCSARVVNREGEPFGQPCRQSQRVNWSKLLRAAYKAAPLPVYMLGNQFAPHCGMWRKRALDQCGEFCETLRATEDFDMWLRILLQCGPWEIVDEVLVDYRRMPGTMSSDADRMVKAWCVVLDRLFAALDARQVPWSDSDAVRGLCEWCMVLTFPGGGGPKIENFEPGILLQRARYAGATEELVRTVLLILGTVLRAPSRSLVGLGATKHEMATAEVFQLIFSARNGRMSEVLYRAAEFVVKNPTAAFVFVRSSFRSLWGYPDERVFESRLRRAIQSMRLAS